MIEPGAHVANYRIIKAIGQGGMGVVYLAEHTLLGRKAAFKVLRTEHSSDTELVERFFAEARTASRLGHRHIVEVTDCGVTPDGESYFVMDLLQGESLYLRIRREGPWPMARSMHVALQLADALGACHEVGVVHRDLKPNNVMLIDHRGDRCFVKLFDFGIAKLLGNTPRRTLSSPRSVLGTPLYMAPEQCMGNPIDHRVDIYALGVMLYELLTGVNPFVGKTWAQVARMQIYEPFPSVLGLRPDLPKGLDNILRKATAKNAAERFQSMGEMRAAVVELIVSVVDHPSQELDAPPLPLAPPVSDAELSMAQTMPELPVVDTDRETADGDVTPRRPG